MRHISVALDDDLLRAQLGRPVQVHRVDCFVGRQGEHSCHAALDGGVHDVLRAQDVGLDGLERVVLAHWHVLQRRGVDDDVRSARRPHEAGPVPDVADEVAHPTVLKLLTKLYLLQFVS